MNRSLLALLGATVLAICFCGAMASSTVYQPGIVYSTFLDAFEYHTNNGRLAFDDFEAIFLPEDVFTKTGTSQMWGIIRRADGTELYRLDFVLGYGDPPFTYVTNYLPSALGPGAGLAGPALEMSSPGDYVMDFFTPAGKFFTFPFTIEAFPSSDPFTPGLYRINGDWERWAYFRYENADPAGNLIFNVWLRNSSGQGDKQVKPKVKIFNKNGGEYVFSARDRGIKIGQKWQRYEFTIADTAEKNPKAIVAGDLLSKDGNYVLKLLLDDQLYGEWEFSVAGGKLSYAGRTVRGQADPLTFIEGGKDCWWYRRN